MQARFLEIGPCQPQANDLPKGEFPKDKFGRHFHAAWYKRIMYDGIVTNREWLTYSCSENKIYCYYCKIFSKMYQPNWVKIGYSNWKNATTNIVLHETSKTHIDASLKIKIKRTSLPIIPSLIEANKVDVITNREIV